MREVISYIIGVPVLLGLAFCLIGVGVIHGLTLGNRLTGRETRWLIFPQRQVWLEQALIIIPIYGLGDPARNSIGSYGTFLGNIPEGYQSIAFSLAVLCGLLFGLAGLTKVGWISLIVALVIVLPATWFIRATENPSVELFLIGSYFTAAGVFGWNISKAIYEAASLQDEIVKDPARAGASDKVLSGLKVLLQDGMLLEHPVAFSIRNRVSGFLKRSLSFSAVVRPDGLYLRIDTGFNETPDFPVSILNPQPRKAIWLLLSWDHLKEISYDKIIGHREILLRLKSSGEELVLESPPRDIEKHLTK